MLSLVILNPSIIFEPINYIQILSALGLWTEGKLAPFGYDFWYQPYWDVMVSSEWGAPKSFRAGYKHSDVLDPSKSLFICLNNNSFITS